MIQTQQPERIQTVVIGGGQTGLSVGYHLARRGLPFIILDANERVGDSWRNRWDSLRLFTPARFDGLDGMRVPASGHSFITKDEMADYLEAYATRFELPVLNGVRVNRLSKNGDSFLIETQDHCIEAEHVVVAMSYYQTPRTPAFAAELDPSIVQLHSADYRNPSQLREGSVLIVGAGNSGAEIAMELAPTHHIAMSGRDTGQVPFRVEGIWGRVLLRPLFRGFFHHVLTTRTPMGRKSRAKVLTQGIPRIRVKAVDLAKAGVELVPRTAGVRDGYPILEDGRRLDVNNIVWCTGFQHNFPWIDIPVFGELGPDHQRGVVPSAPGLYFAGLPYIYSFSSAMIHGVGRDTNHIARTIAARTRALRAVDEPQPQPVTH